MSKPKEKDETQTTDTQAAVGILEPEITEPDFPEVPEVKLNDEGLIEFTDEQFENYTVPTETILETDIKHLLKPGVDLSHVNFEWKRFDEAGDAQARYFTTVRPDLHGKWFKDPGKAFNRQYRAIVRGLRGGNPEIILMVRSAKAAAAEQKAFQAQSEANTPTNSAKLRNAISGLADQIGAENVRDGIKYTTGMKWGAGSKN